MTTIASYLSVANDLGRWRAITEKTPNVALETKYFKDNIGKATNIESLLKDRRLFNYAMKAFGLGDRTFAVGMMRKVLEQGVDDSRDLSRTLRNPNIYAFAKAFDYAANGTAVPSEELIKDVTSRYIEQAMQAEQGKRNPGVELALYFREKAPEVSNIYGVLADKRLLLVVQTTLGISPNSSAQPIDTQARLLKSKLNIDDFKDAKKLDAFIGRFAAMYDTQNQGTVSSDMIASNALLFSASRIGSDGPIGIDFSLILRMQTASRGF